MTNKRLHVEKYFDGENFIENKVFTLSKGKIVAIDNDISKSDEVLSGLVVPGFIDLQVNGGGGVLLNSTPTAAGIEKIMQAHIKFGTTAMLPTLITDKVSVMQQAADAIAEAINNNVMGIIGIHFEGPHLSVAKKGAHSEEYIRKITDEEWQVLSRKDIGQILVTLAPENVSVEDIKRMVDMGIKVCLGHTNADFETAQKAIDAGADGFTHLFNAMSPLQGREPGVVGSALLNDKASCGLIVDGHHVDFASCLLAIKTKPQGKLFLVTDAMPPLGTDDKEFMLFDRKVILDGGKLTSPTGGLAGSVLDMATAIKNTHQILNIELGEAINMATAYPANYVNQQSIRGRLFEGCQADFVVLSNSLSVEQTWISGKQVY
ncbi:N-acetylglucosamine-6-phosphate deacetylase [Colwellia sp. 1_MG-2023]|jgi:N-acetylglucosamine-6-phosphate deacetylase|uniref:N-acetylglucosamine-6-phosphate deacetylase n=1 Tax=unclassified Colwellia TaxID=196834 RepID=UPI001C0882DA|nr:MULTISPECIES: N-acetylglucosamine-6-phosphate deacetylase [unclassified Colwellia]MBU2926296.1 N-acetylglucosamine-6-phosphate deacetylase [Colwellia sp. C2M11]MDO6651734.1 N-acetylglucosamine-6-phosphate deacetylase [Colwellia sp. 3_MG-2023]MDO6665355.1 N-acetylglucosamine-6-phosphate deacetylase [Colwellia sp. 2_MG-2023]MDO6689728.1 N-acetylglucosamine-6-phosphate deacetylase [Colwellia sp. 1_MG-2023]